MVKCPVCFTWHRVSEPCACVEKELDEEDDYLYRRKSSLVTNTEMKYLDCIKEILPEDCLIQPQVNLAAMIRRTDGSRYQNELFRNVDFVITDLEYKPLIAIEINDQTHNAPDRRARDKRVSEICEEAGIPLITFWTSYGVNQEYMEKRIYETLAALPVPRVHHFVKEEARKKRKKGCYIATCVYGSYDCPQVWTLRRYRDFCLANHWYGRAFIRLYYAVSPGLVKCFGSVPLVRGIWRCWLDFLVSRLQSKGMASGPYKD